MVCAGHRDIPYMVPARHRLKLLHGCAFGETKMTDQRLLPPLAALRAFEAVGRLGGIRRAAKELTIDHAVVSRHIRSLEAWVGVQLLVRSSTGYTLTEPGELYHQQKIGRASCRERV